MSKKSILIVGLGRFGLSLLENLSKQKCEIVAIDVNPEAVEKASAYIDHCFICDATKDANLQEIGVKHVDHAIVAIGNNIQSTLLTTIVLKELGINKITVRIDDEYYSQVMHRVGATEIILPEKLAAETLSHRIVSDNIIDYYHIQGNYAVVQIKVNSEYKETSLISLDSRNRFNVNIVGIIRDGSFFIPKGSDMVINNDTILLIGADKNVYRFEQYLNEKNI